jgi:hypothetical protein
MNKNTSEQNEPAPVEARMTAEQYRTHLFANTGFSSERIDTLVGIYEQELKAERKVA